MLHSGPFVWDKNPGKSRIAATDLTKEFGALGVKNDVS